MLGAVDGDLVADQHLVAVVLEGDLVATRFEHPSQLADETSDLIDPSVGAGER